MEDFSDGLPSSLTIEEIHALHSKLLSGKYPNYDSLLSHLVPFYLSLPIKSPLKKPIQLILREAHKHTRLLPFLSDVVTDRVTSLSQDLFGVLEECMELLPDGIECIQNNLHFILTAMNKFLLINVTRAGGLFTMIKSYHKIIANLQPHLQQCLASSVSIINEYCYLKDNLVMLSKEGRLCDFDEHNVSQLFSGVVSLLIYTGDDELTQTAIFVIIQLMRCLAERNDEFFHDLELILNTISFKNKVFNARILFGIISGSASEFLFLTSESTNDPIFSKIILTIKKFFLTERDDVARLKLCRCLHSCLVTVSKCVHTPQYGAMLKRCLTDSNCIRKTIVNIIMNHWDSYSEHIRHVTKDIFEEFLVLLNIVLTSNSHSYLEELAQSFLTLDVKLTTKYKYLSLLSNYIPLGRWMELEPLLPTTLPAAMEECALATHAGEFWCRLVSQHSLQFSDIQPWIDALLTAISRVSEKHAQHIYDYCKKGILSCHPVILQYIAEHIPATEQGLLFLVQCHKQTQKQLTAHEVTQCLSTEQLALSLHSSSPDLTLSVLELLCKSHKSTAILSKEDLVLILEGFVLLVGTRSNSCRKNLVTTLKVLIGRIEKSAHKLNQKNLRSDDQESNSGCILHYSTFMSDFSYLLFALLNPISPCGVIEVVLTLFPLILRLYVADDNLFPPDFSISNRNLVQLLSVLKDTYESHCSLAFNALLVLKDRLRIWLSSDANYCILLDEMFSLMASPVSVHSTSASYYLRLLFRMDPDRLHMSIRRKYPHISDRLYAPEEIPHIELRCVYDLMDLLANQLLTSQDQWDPMKNCFYSLLRSIRNILGSEESVVSCSLTTLQHCFDELTHLCTQVLVLTGPIVCSSSPEGALPPDDISSEVALDSHSPNSRAILLCSWQALKEISLLYSGMVEVFLPAHPSLFYCSFLTQIYEFYLNYLMEARHRGAFELTYTGFVRLCNFVWLSPSDSTNCLPSVWLESVLNSLSKKECSDNRQMKLLSCATRRSAGLPFLVLAILANEPKHLNNKYFNLTMDTLTSLAATLPRSDDEMIITVHCLNIMRALFKDNKLRDSVHQYVSAAIKLVLNCVVSRHWPIRNASHLLFSSIITRVFGVKRIQDEHAWQNKLTLNNFFTRYPNLLEIFIYNLNSSAENSSEIQSDYSVFMILTILSRLYISKSESNVSPTHCTFISPLLSLSETPSWKLREMCAHAICSLLITYTQADVFLILQQHLHSLSNSPLHNSVHGFLLILQEYHRTRCTQFSGEDSIEVFKFCFNLIPLCANCVANNCLLMRILAAILSRCSADRIGVLTAHISSLCSHLPQSCQTIRGDTLLLQTKIRCYLALTLTLVNKLDSNQHLLISTLLAIVSDFLDRSSTMLYCIQSLLEQPLSCSTHLPLSKLFAILFHSDTGEKITCLKTILHIGNYNIEVLAHELTEFKVDLREAFDTILNLSSEPSVFDEELGDIIAFAGCLLLALYSMQQLESVITNRIVHLMYETVLQDPSTLDSISVTVSAIYKIVLSQKLVECSAIREWWFLLLHIIEQGRISQVLSSLIVSTYQTGAKVTQVKFPPSPHPTILTKVLLENIASTYCDTIALDVLLFLLENYAFESDVGIEDVGGADKIFEETNLIVTNQADIVLVYILRAIEKLISGSQQGGVLIEEIHSRYLKYDKQVSAGRIKWNRKESINNLKCDIVKYILDKCGYGHDAIKRTLRSHTADHDNLLNNYMEIIPFFV